MGGSGSSSVRASVKEISKVTARLRSPFFHAHCGRATGRALVQVVRLDRVLREPSVDTSFGDFGVDCAFHGPDYTFRVISTHVAESLCMHVLYRPLPPSKFLMSPVNPPVTCSYPLRSLCAILIPIAVQTLRVLQPSS
jgi:hypothetical protein